jgi:hypothetical protein
MPPFLRNCADYFLVHPAQRDGSDARSTRSELFTELLLKEVGLPEHNPVCLYGGSSDPLCTRHCYKGYVIQLICPRQADRTIIPVSRHVRCGYPGARKRPSARWTLPKPTSRFPESVCLVHVLPFPALARWM